MFSSSRLFTAKAYRYILLPLLLLPLHSLAQHSDIWMILEGNQTTVSETDLEFNTPVLVDATTDRLLFTTDFGDLGGGPQGTDDPGFQALSGTYTAGSILNYRAVGSLLFWDGSAWVNDVVDQERLQVIDVLSTVTSIGTDTITNPEGFVGQVLSDSSVHDHIDFQVENSLGTGGPATGAYLIDLEFFVTSAVDGPVIHTVSDPARIAFNHQLTTEEFDNAIAALTTPANFEVAVPLPGILPGMMLFILGVIFSVTRLQKRASKR